MRKCFRDWKVCEALRELMHKEIEQERAESRAEGRAEERTSAIQTLVETLKELGMISTGILQKLCEKYGLSAAEAAKFI